MEKVSTSLFDGVSKEEYAAMMTCFKTTVKSYRKGEEVPMPAGRVGVVQRGRISLLKTDINGVRTIFEQLGAGGVFGENLGFAWTDDGFFLLAEEYFATHLDAAEWNALPEERRRGALVTAEADLASLTGNRLDPENVRHRNAVFEQALYLTRLPSPGRPLLASEEISGLGGRSWQKQETPEFSPRALRLLEELLRPEPHLLRG